MKKKFESNVASEIPKTKLHEPGLPWKLTDEDMEAMGPKDTEYKSALSGTPPLKTRAIFLIMLVIAVFVIVSLIVINTTMENENIRRVMMKKDKEMAAVKTSLEKVAVEKESLNKNAVTLEKKVNDLTAQKELFATVIESLTKKADETDTDKKDEQKTPDSVQGASN